MMRFLKGATIRLTFIVSALVVVPSTHGRTISLQVPLWEQVRQLECREYSRHVCYPEKLSCAIASGSAIWDINFDNNLVISRRLNMSFTITGYAHAYYNLLGTATNEALLNDGGLMEFHDLDRSNVHIARLRLLRNLADSIVVIDFECQRKGKA